MRLTPSESQKHKTAKQAISVIARSPKRSSEHLLCLAQAIKQLHLLWVKNWEIKLQQLELYRTCSLMYNFKYSRTFKFCYRSKQSPPSLAILSQLQKGSGLLQGLIHRNPFLFFPDYGKKDGTWFSLISLL